MMAGAINNSFTDAKLENIWVIYFLFLGNCSMFIVFKKINLSL
jgi:hypothetical protein